jgi:universal stress protein A
VPDDFSPPAAVAFKLACELARDHQARLTLLHVPHPVLTYDQLVESRRPGFRDDLRAELHRLRSSDPAVTVTHLILEGDPAEVIVDVAREHGCDLIVMGTHGRSGLGRLVLGSVAEQVIRHAPCPVLTSKAPVGQPEPVTPRRPSAEELFVQLP